MVLAPRPAGMIMRSQVRHLHFCCGAELAASPLDDKSVRFAHRPHIKGEIGDHRTISLCLQRDQQVFSASRPKDKLEVVVGVKVNAEIVRALWDLDAADYYVEFRVESAYL